MITPNILEKCDQGFFRWIPLPLVSPRHAISKGRRLPHRVGPPWSPECPNEIRGVSPAVEIYTNKKNQLYKILSSIWICISTYHISDLINGVIYQVSCSLPVYHHLNLGSGTGCKRLADTKRWTAKRTLASGWNQGGWGAVMGELRPNITPGYHIQSDQTTTTTESMCPMLIKTAVQGDFDEFPSSKKYQNSEKITLS